VLVVASLSASLVIGGIEALPRVERGISRDSKLTSAERRNAAAIRLRLDPAPFEAFRAQLRSRERYAVDVPAGKPAQLTSEGKVVRAYGAFFFLPAIQVRQSEHVFRYRFP
jgi:hypothetical protein